MKWVQIIGGIAAILLAGVLLGWWNTELRPATLTSLNNPTDPAPPAALGVISSPGENLSATAMQIMKTAPMTHAQGAVLSTNWAERVENLLNEPLSNTEKSAALLAMFASLPEDGQTEVATELSHLLSDGQYAELGQYLTNSAIAAPVREVLMTELLGRSDAIRLPWLLELARTQQGPGAGEAKGLLEVLLDNDNGSDWERLEAEVEQHLLSKPE